MYKSLDELNEAICDKFGDGEIGVVVFDSPDYLDAFLGISDDNRAIYDYDKMVESLMKKDGMTEEEAIEFIEFNTIRSLPYYDNCPIILYKV